MKIKTNSITNYQDNGSVLFPDGIDIQNQVGIGSLSDSYNCNFLGITTSSSTNVSGNGLINSMTANLFQGDGSQITNSYAVSGSRVYVINLIISDPPLKS